MIARKKRKNNYVELDKKLKITVKNFGHRVDV